MTPGIVEYLAASEESPNWFEDSWDSGRNPDLWFYRAPHSGNPGAFSADVDGNGEAAVDPGTAVFPQPRDIVPGVELRGRGDLRA